MLDGKKTYGSAVVASLIGGAGFLTQRIPMEDLISVCLVAIGFIMLRIALANNTALLEKILKKGNRK